MENEMEKKNIEDHKLANVAGGVPGELICHAASTVVSILFSLNNDEHTGSALSDSSTGDGKASRSEK